MQFPKARILIFAKAPEPGLAKTRLIPALGEAGAADLAAKLLQHAVRTRSQANIAPVSVYCAPNTAHAAFHQLAADFPIRLFPQTGGDLGERMLAAVQQALTDADAVLLTGSDVPSLPLSALRQAIALLQAQPELVVLSPAEDGGYGLLGLSKGCPALFADMPWGTDRVLELTLARCEQVQRPVHLLETVWDVDRPEDLLRLRQSRYWPEL